MSSARQVEGPGIGPWGTPLVRERPPKKKRVATVVRSHRKVQVLVWVLIKCRKTLFNVNQSLFKANFCSTFRITPLHTRLQNAT